MDMRAQAEAEARCGVLKKVSVVSISLVDMSSEPLQTEAAAREMVWGLSACNGVA